MQLEYFQEGIVGERMDSYPWVKLACTDQLSDSPRRTCGLSLTSILLNTRPFWLVCDAGFRIRAFDSRH